MQPYTTSSPLLTDLYQLTMAYGYWKLGMHEQESVFHLSYRRNPFKGDFAICCGLQSAVDYLNNWSFADDDLAYLATLQNSNDERLFPQDFLDYLRTVKFSCDVDAIAEGTVVFPHEPLLRIQGPLLQCQLLESPLLNIINFQTLIATKAARVCHAAGDDPVLEFGLRRAQGPDGALSASRAAYIGGCAATSNALAGKLFDIPVRGTHAHSWVTAFASEAEAFDAYCEVLPHNGVLLVDTYNTIDGVKRAIEAGEKLRAKGADLLGVRLDSGDMASLSIEARKLLDAAGFTKTHILASNSLDEYTIRNLKEKGAKISMWGVGTNLATAYDQPALDGVYKLSALKNKNGEWEYKLKLSEDAVKISNPGRHQVRRYFANNNPIADIIYDIELGIETHPKYIILEHGLAEQTLEAFDCHTDLLEPIFRHGKIQQKNQSIHRIREYAKANVNDFYQQENTTNYAAGLERNLSQLKDKLISKVKC